ncbi:glycosyltransferase involved in cell wall biosynthesis [Thiogranum longum]|uniref:Glycosyltransferase involved in cell wall biosynthesis n=1 Tax=Thiogranum longum TaxID=1537524 RepID=A0A4R1HC38_9GAMM|nr:glycosyltransferase family 2 protein [Thiogranum longum]TCK18103.1 glycosyltransferase involved in cell wall biosynthesis [Thiogranum longum]
MNMPLVTIITVTKNSESYLEETIESVITQSYPNIEYLIIDGKSDDGTVDIIKKYEKHIAYWCSEPDGSMYHAINKGIQRSNGDIIAVLNSDDRYYSNEAVETAVDLLRKGDAVGVYGNMLVDYGKKLRTRRVFDVSFESYLMSMKGTFVPHITLFVKRSVINELNGYQEKYRYAADYDFILRVLKNYRLQFIPVTLAVFRRHASSITASGKIAPERDLVLQDNGLYEYSIFRRKFTYFWGWVKYYALNSLGLVKDVLRGERAV